MAEKKTSGTETSQLLDQISRSTSAARPRRQSRSSPWLVLIVLLMAIGTGGAFFWLYQQQQAISRSLITVEQANRSLAESVESDMSALRQANQDAREQLSAEIEQGFEQHMEQRLEQSIAEALESTMMPQLPADSAAIERLRSQFIRDIEQLNTQVLSLQRQLATVQNRDLRLDYREVDHLLRLADRKLQLETDVASALLLMRDADRILEQIDSTMGNALRAQLDTVIPALEDLSLPDVSSVHARLQTFIDRSAGMNLRDVMRSAYEQRRQGDRTGADADGGHPVWDTLRGIFVVRQWDQPAGERLSPQHDAMVMRGFRLQIEQAQLALMLGDQALFSAALTQARTLLAEYFDIESVDVREMEVELARLADLQIRPALPDLSPVLSQAAQLSGTQGASP